jgi:hypothetical protein
MARTSGSRKSASGWAIAGSNGQASRAPPPPNIEVSGSGRPLGGLRPNRPLVRWRWFWRVAQGAEYGWSTPLEGRFGNLRTLGDSGVPCGVASCARMGLGSSRGRRTESSESSESPSHGGERRGDRWLPLADEPSNPGWMTRTSGSRKSASGWAIARSNGQASRAPPPPNIEVSGSGRPMGGLRPNRPLVRWRWFWRVA